MNNLELLISFLEGAIEQQIAIAESLTEHSGPSMYAEGKLEALTDVLEHVLFLQANYLNYKEDEDDNT